MKTKRLFPPLSWFRLSRRRATRRPGFRPNLEGLEDRQVPAVVHWTGAAGDNQWLTAGNWNGGQLPTANDDVVIDVVDDPTIIYAGGDTTIHSLESAENVQLTGGTLTVVGTVHFSAGALSEAGGTLITSGDQSSTTTAGPDQGGTTDPTPTDPTPTDPTPTDQTPTDPISTDGVVTTQDNPPVDTPPQDVVPDPVVVDTSSPSDTTTEPQGVILTMVPPKTSNSGPTTRVVIPPPGSIQLDLEAASDTGVSSSDNFTSRTTVVFDVTVNQAGQVKIDYTGDGLWDMRQNFNAAGTYQMTASGLREGHRTVTARLLPVAATSSALTTLDLTVDSTAPHLMTNPTRELPPVSSRTLIFSEAIDPSTFGVNDVTVLRPDGSQAAVTGLTGGGTTWTVQFAASSAWGPYQVLVGPDVRDLAGNPMSQQGVDRFVADQAPVLDNSGALHLVSIHKNAFHNRGVSVLRLLASAGGTPITDADAGAKQGIAVTGVDGTNGKWQFSLDGGQSWQSLNGVSSSSARLLAANRRTRIRFVPAKDYVGVIDPGVTFQAWDRTAGFNGGTLSIDSVGGASAFSAAVETASIEVTA